MTIIALHDFNRHYPLHMTWRKHIDEGKTFLWALSMLCLLVNIAIWERLQWVWTKSEIEQQCMFGNTKDDDDYIEGEAWGGSYHFTNKQLRENPRYRHFIAIIVKMALVWKVLKIVYRRWWWEPFKQMKGISLDKIREKCLMFFSVYNRLVIDKPFTTVSQLLLWWLIQMLRVKLVCSFVEHHGDNLILFRLTKVIIIIAITVAQKCKAKGCIDEVTPRVFTAQETTSSQARKPNFSLFF